MLVSDCDTFEDYSKRNIEYKHVRIFLFKIVFNVIEHNLD